MTRPRILVVATIGRADLLAMFEQVAAHADLTFLEYASTPGVTPQLYEPYGQLTTWEEHRSARSLLRQRPAGPAGDAGDRRSQPACLAL